MILGLTSEEWQIIRLTLGTSALSIVLMFPWALGLAWLLARAKWPGKPIVETFVALPLVMPPVATGFVLLRLLGRHRGLGAFLEMIGLDGVVFTWRGVVVATAVMSFPLLVRSVRVAFEEVNPRLEQIARSLGAGHTRVFMTITLPLISRGLLAGTIFSFARAIGEFGATIVVAGNIPGKTSTLALSIFQRIQLGDDVGATRLLVVCALIAFSAIWSSEYILRQWRRS